MPTTPSGDPGNTSRRRAQGTPVNVTVEITTITGEQAELLHERQSLAIKEIITWLTTRNQK
ncbi:hypothetical protein [Catellatospora chokoriensis]|nr:hypothetical protein [Catellatospora chokoriensis]